MLGPLTWNGYICSHMSTQILDGQPLIGVLCSVVALTVVCWLIRGRFSCASSLPLPPGPKPLPVVGNLFDIPTRRLGASFRSISEKHGTESSPTALQQQCVLTSVAGDVAYLSTFGQPMIVLGSYDAACALLEDRSANTSDRQHSVMAEL